jgi:hypothetical protein
LKQASAGTTFIFIFNAMHWQDVEINMINMASSKVHEARPLLAACQRREARAAVAPEFGNK